MTKAILPIEQLEKILKVDWPNIREAREKSLHSASPSPIGTDSRSNRILWVVFLFVSSSPCHVRINEDFMKYKGVINFILFLMAIALVVSIFRMTKPIGTGGGETVSIDLFVWTLKINRSIRAIIVVLLYLFPLLFIRHRYWTSAILLWTATTIIGMEKLIIISFFRQFINVLYANYFVSTIEIFFLVVAIFLLIKLKKTFKQFEANNDIRSREVGQR